MTAGATALAMQPVEMSAEMTEAEFAASVQAEADPAAIVATAPVLDPQPLVRPFAAALATDAASAEAHFMPAAAQPLPSRPAAETLRQPDPFAEADMVNRQIGRASCRERVCQYV